MTGCWPQAGRTLRILRYGLEANRGVVGAHNWLDAAVNRRAAAEFGGAAEAVSQAAATKHAVASVAVEAEHERAARMCKRW